MLTSSLRHTLFRMGDEFIAVGEVHEHAIFGSTSLVLNGALNREPGDIDVFVSRRVWGALLARHEEGWFVETPNAGDPPILSNENWEIPVHLFYDWRDEKLDIDVDRMLFDARPSEEDAAWRVIPVKEALRHKEEAFRWAEYDPSVNKHGPDIVKIKRWLDRCLCRDHAWSPSCPRHPKTDATVFTSTHTAKEAKKP